VTACLHWVMSALSEVLSTRVGRRIKFGEVSCTECKGQGNDFELIPTVQIETGNPVEGYFGSEFSAICNHCGVMAAWSRKTVIFCVFWTTTPYGKIFKILFRKFLSRHRSTLWCSNVVKFVRLEISEIVRYLVNKKISSVSQTVATARIVPKICQGHPQQCSQSAPDFIQIGLLSAES